MSGDRYSFPTRQYSYRTASAQAGLFPDAEPPFSFTAGKVFRFILGRTPQPEEMTLAEVNTTLHDPFARFVLGPGHMPMTLRSLLQTLHEQPGVEDEIPDQRSFVVADGGQIPWSQQTQDLRREIRLLVSRGPKTQTPLLLVSSSTQIDDPSTFLQVIGWDKKNGAYQFYDRREEAWIWAGSSWDALEPDSRGNGPFDSHVNGALNMKEMKLPWIHWHSESASIQDTVLAPDDRLLSETLWTKKSEAQSFETDVAHDGIRRWTDSRFARRTVGGSLTRLPEFLRQVLDTSTVNLIASDSETATLEPGLSMRLPPTFFINFGALSDVLGFNPAPDLTVDGGTYLKCLEKYAVHLTDGNLSLPGDTHFPFVVPEAAFEDVDILKGLMKTGVLPDKLAACLLMVDFCNPVFSVRRAALLPHVPELATVGASSDFAAHFVAAVEAATRNPNDTSPESEFLRNWRLPDNSWRSEFQERIDMFFAGVKASLASLQLFSPIFELADSRRREFRRRPLAEFKLTTPVTNIPEDAPFLEFTAAGSVRKKS